VSNAYTGFPTTRTANAGSSCKTSTPEDRTRQQTFVRTLRASLPRRAELEVIPFGGHPRPGQSTRLRPALLASQGAERVFLLSDGLFEEPLAELRALARSLGVAIDLPAHLPGPRRQLVALKLTLLEKPSAFRPARIALTYRATYDGQAQLTLEAQRAGTGKVRPLGRRALLIRPGTHRTVGRIPPLPPGLYRIRLRIKPASGKPQPYQQKALLVEVGKAPRILLVSDTPDGGTVGRALAASRHQVDRIAPGDMPLEIDGLLPYREVVFSELRLSHIPPRASAVLTRWVRELGGGLLLADGKQALQRPDWTASPLAELFPLAPGNKPEKPRSPKQAKPKKNKRDDKPPRKPRRKPGKFARPVLALVLVIDRSGSMEGKKLRLAKEAAIACVDTLHPTDVIGVVAFDSSPHWLVRPTQARYRPQITRMISRLEADGDTHIYRALKTVARMLKGVKCPVKHVVLLSDGHTEPALFRKLVEGMTRQNITLSAIGIGKDFDQQLLQQLARWGKGRFNFATDPQEIPQYVIRETRMALKRAAPHREQQKKQQKKQQQKQQQAKEQTPAKKSIAQPPRKPTEPRRVNKVRAVFRAPFLVGLGGRFPDLGAIAPARVRPGATLFLETSERQPVLAAWRSGLGRVGLFNGSLQGEQAGDWPAWSQLPRYQAQLVSFLLAEQRSGQQLLIEGKLQWPTPELLRLDLWITGHNGTPRSAKVTLRDAISGDVLSLTPQILAPGRLRFETRTRAAFPAWSVQPGASLRHYLAERPLPVERRRLTADPVLLNRLSRDSGGQLGVRADGAQPAAPLRRKPAPIDSTPLLAAGLVFWCLGVGLWRFSGQRAAHVA